MAPNPKVKFTPDGIPYVLEFSAVSVWPRIPINSPTAALLPDLTPGKPDFTRNSRPTLTRSNTTTSTHPRTLDKALPPLPRPGRSSSLRLFRRKTSQGIPESESDEGYVHVDRPVGIDSEPRSRFKRRGTWQAIPTGPTTSSSRNARPSAKAIFGSSTNLPPAMLSDLDLMSGSSRTGKVSTDVGDRADRPAKRTPSSQPDGLFIRFADSSLQQESQPSSDPSLTCEETGVQTQGKTPSSILRRLRRTLAHAILAEGMDTPSQASTSALASSMIPEASNAHYDGDNEERGQGGRQGALFTGTFGQVKAAFIAAGLAVSQCPEDGFGEGAFPYQYNYSHDFSCNEAYYYGSMFKATRLGAVFVARTRDDGGVMFKKIVLWG